MGTCSVRWRRPVGIERVQFGATHNCENNNTIIIIMAALTFPVETIKPFVFLNVSNATFLITQSLCAVISEGWKDYKNDSENFLNLI